MFKFIFKRNFYIGLLLLFAVLNAGCWGAKFIGMPQRSIDTSSAVDTLIAREKNLEKRLDELQQQFVRQQEYSRITAAGSKMDAEAIKDQLNAISQMLLESSQIRPSQGNNIPSRQRNDSSPALQRIEKDNLEAVSKNDSLGVTASDSALTGAPGNIPSAEVIYRQIYLDFSRMEYQISLDDSKIFLEEYPGDPLEQEVIFIRGECFIEQEKFFDALKEFSKILKKYPNGKKVPAALLRMAIAYDRLGDSDLAAGVIRRLVRDYPYSEEAAVAKEKFGEMLED
jgi:TolA-binding protein